MQHVVQPLHLADERGDVVLPAGDRARAPTAARDLPDCRSAAPSPPRAPPRRASERSPRRARRSARPRSPSASVATIGLPIASASNTVKRRAFPERREHADVERRHDARDVARETGEHEPVAQAERRAPGLRGPARSGPSPNTIEARLRPLVEHQPARPRRDTSCPSSRAAGSPSRSTNSPAVTPSSRARRGDLLSRTRAG